AKNVTLSFQRDITGDTPPLPAAPTVQRWNLMLQADQDPLHPGLEDLLPAFLTVDFDLATGKIANNIASGTTGGFVSGTKNDFLINPSLLLSKDPYNVSPPATPATTPGPLGTFAATDQINIHFDGTTPLSQFSGVNSLAATDQDGSATGSLQTFTISQDGVITGVFSNGRTQSIAQMAIATFSNPSGLEKLEGSMYRPSANSGLASVGQAGLAGRGSLAGGTLEMSNVDLAQEFTNLIVAQRGFQANTRVITASDEVLQDLVQMKR
ncbi:MAG: flagellar hook-basal body protein, partial [Acidimicrobiales bacterium]|nr:flagellar hook-basal body protein [Acidimicrobiales bacterium]